MYHRIQARREPGGIRVLLISDRGRCEDFIYELGEGPVNVADKVESVYGTPASGAVEVVAVFGGKG